MHVETERFLSDLQHAVNLSFGLLEDGIAIRETVTEAEFVDRPLAADHPAFQTCKIDRLPGAQKTTTERRTAPS